MSSRLSCLSEPERSVTRNSPLRAYKSARGGEGEGTFQTLEGIIRYPVSVQKKMNSVKLSGEVVLSTKNVGENSGCLGPYWGVYGASRPLAGGDGLAAAPQETHRHCQPCGLCS